MVDFDKIRESIESDLAIKTALCDIANSLKCSQKWEMPEVWDEEACTYKRDDNGDIIRRTPTADDSSYYRYMAYNTVLATIEKILLK